jgi:hypothetical protein
MPSPHEIESGIARIEGYLLCQTEISNARAEAEAFARRMPWLTAAQHEEIVRLYTEDRMELSRRVLQRIADRCRELRAEYTARYEELRRRLVCACVAVVLGAFALCVCTLLVTSAG